MDKNLQAIFIEHSFFRKDDENQMKKEDEQNCLPNQFLRRHNQAQKSDAKEDVDRGEVISYVTFVILISLSLD